MDKNTCDIIHLIMLIMVWVYGTVFQDGWTREKLDLMFTEAMRLSIDSMLCV